MDKISNKQTLKHVTAHELFHVVQNGLLNGNAEKVTHTLTKWWIEATAEYAACRIAWQLPTVGQGPDAVYAYLPERALTECGVIKCPHGTLVDNDIEYARGYLLDFLVRNGVSFKQLFLNVMGKLQEKKGSNYGDLIPEFEQALREQDVDMARLMRDFNAWFHLADQAPKGLISNQIPNFKGQVLDRDPLMADPTRKPALLHRTSTYPCANFDLRPPYTGSLRAFRLDPKSYPLSDDTDQPVLMSRQNIRLELQPDEGIGWVDLFILPDGERTAQPQAVATLDGGSQSTNVVLERGYTLYLLATNQQRKQNTRLTVSLAPSDDCIGLRATATVWNELQGEGRFKFREYSFILLNETQMRERAAASVHGRVPGTNEMNEFLDLAWRSYFQYLEDYVELLPIDCRVQLETRQAYVAYHGAYKEYNASGDVIYQAEFDRSIRISEWKKKSDELPSGINPLGNTDWNIKINKNK